jgi:hypothetical protein
MLADFLKSIDTQNKARINELKVAINGVTAAGRYQSSQLQQFLSSSFKLCLKAATRLPPRTKAGAIARAGARAVVSLYTSA